MVQHNQGLPKVVRTACAAEPMYTRFGSIFHDLPYYYAPMVFEAVRYGLGAPALDEPWGYRLHSVRPERLVASYIQAARTVPGLTEPERLALVGGLLSHCAIDLAMHPLVNYCARRDTVRYGGFESTHHRLTEKYQALFLHIERFGEDQIGTAAFAERCRISKRGTSLSVRIEPALVQLMTSAFRGAYGTAPPPLQFCKWVRNFRQFGILLSAPIVAKNSQRTRTDAMRDRYFINEVFDCREYFAAAERRLGKLGTLGYEYFVAGDFSRAAEDRFCAESGIDDLAEPTPIDIPAIPLLSPVRGKVKLPRAAAAANRDEAAGADLAADAAETAEAPRPRLRFRLPRVSLRRKKPQTTVAAV